ncbi:MAG: hypothetical protein EOP56_19290 [Sphingobacteriales bacterium]|nr:MAG: hypothetical protein EOP56_19290 [Sphingobacteriales bacterium]
MDAIIGLITVGVIIYWISKNTKGKRKIAASSSSRSVPKRAVQIAKLQIEGVLIQVLETIYILEYSASPDTVTSRLAFLRERLTQLSTYNATTLKQALISAIARYREAYYDRPVTESQIKIVETSNDILDNWQSFSDKYLYDSMLRYISVQRTEIEQLKTTKGKQNRAAKVATIIDETGIHLYSADTKNKAEAMKKKLLEAY